MSSPTNTVNTVMQWLSGILKIWLPTLPLSGVWARFEALWQQPVPGKLPDPQSPLPWNIGVEPGWRMPIDGVKLLPSQISIVVQQTDGSPSVEVPLTTSPKKGAMPAPGTASKAKAKTKKPSPRKKSA